MTHGVSLNYIQKSCPLHAFKFSQGLLPVTLYMAVMGPSLTALIYMPGFHHRLGACFY